MAQLVHQPTDLNGPAHFPPPGVEPRLDGRSDGMIYAYALLPVLGLLAATFLTLRIYTKAWLVRRFNVPDYLLLLGFPLYVATLVVGAFVIRNGAGSHQWNVLLKDYIKMYYWINTAEAMWNVNMFIVKTAIVLQYLEMLAPNRTVDPLMWWSSCILIAMMFIFYTGGLFSGLFICTPRTSIWNVLEKGRCNNEARLVLNTALFNILSDLIILLLPVRSVWKMRIAAQKKTAIIVLFCTGLSACVAAAVRICYMAILSSEGDDPDLTYSIIWVGVWSCIEIMLGIMIACSLTLPKFFRYHGMHFTSFLSKLPKPTRSFKPSFVKSTPQTESEGRKKKEAERNVALSFIQGQSSTINLRASRIVLDGAEKDVELGNVETRGPLKSVSTMIPSLPEKSQPQAVGVARDESSKTHTDQPAWMDVQFETGGYLLDGESEHRSSRSATTRR